VVIARQHGGEGPVGGSSRDALLARGSTMSYGSVYGIPPMNKPNLDRTLTGSRILRVS